MEVLVKKNRKFKDSVFTFLFKEPEASRELFYALEGVRLPPDAKIEINTLTDVLVMDQINDLSFLVDDRLLVLSEHQSTVNPNMALRMLHYLVELYDKMVDGNKRFSSVLQKIPAPEFYVLYNGKAKYPETEVLKLSDAFKDTGGLKNPGWRVPLELEVKVFNINKGYNPDILSRSEKLGGYSTLVDKIRENEKTMGREDAFKSAIRDCIESGILRDFLKRHGKDVYKMWLKGWNLDEAKEVWREEAFDEGMEKGIEKARAEAAVQISQITSELDLERTRHQAELESLKAEIERLKTKP
jgi:hypothetical protein